LAGNLRVTNIDHRYWTSRKGNALRYALWAERRSHAGPYLREIAPHFGEKDGAHLMKASASFVLEAAVLAKLAGMFPVGGDEKPHWDETNIKRAEEHLAEAEVHYEAGIAAIQAAVRVDFTPFETKDADKLEKLVTDRNLLVSEAALAALVTLAPPDLDLRLARLMADEPDEKKEMADGPIHRHILFALARLNSAVATEAIGKAVFFAGASDAVAPSVSKWAAEIYWKRTKEGSRDRFVRALDSEVPHVVDLGIKYLGMSGDESLLPKLARFETPAAYQARIRLGDETAWPLLVKGLATPAWYASYSRLRELGAKVEPHVFPYLEDENPVLVTYVAALLSRVGTQRSLPLVTKAVADHPENARIKQALDDLRKRLEKK